MPARKQQLCILLIALFGLCSSPIIAQDKERIALDFIGDSHYSENNYSDLINPYSGIDSWVEAKLSVWTNDANKNFGPFVSLLGSNVVFLKDPGNDLYFDWQKFFQLGGGVQWHPYYRKESSDYKQSSKKLKKGLSKYLQNDTTIHKLTYGVRLFAFAGKRFYYGSDTLENKFSDFVTWDTQLGMDYYFDNIYNSDSTRYLTVIAWTNASFRFTNFSIEGYRNFLWTGNFKIGPNLRRWQKIKWKSLLLPYVTVDWTYTKSCHCRWWENYLRVGGGLKYFPAVYMYKNDSIHNELVKEIWQRFNIYVEGYQNLFWLGDRAPGKVKKWDLHIGLGFATRGFTRTDKKAK